MVEGISKEILDMLSYRSAPGQSLKQISLREPPLDLVLDDIAKYHSSYILRQNALPDKNICPNPALRRILNRLLEFENQLL